MDLKNILKEDGLKCGEVKEVNVKTDEDKIRKHKKPVQLRDIESRSITKRSETIESDENITKMLSNERSDSLKKPWNKLDTGLKMNRLKIFIINEKKKNNLDDKHEDELKTLLMSLCQSGKLNKNTDVHYLINDSKVESIKNLKYDKNKSKYTYKEPDIRVKKHSGSKCRSNIDRFINNR